MLVTGGQCDVWGQSWGGTLLLESLAQAPEPRACDHNVLTLNNQLVYQGSSRVWMGTICSVFIEGKLKFKFMQWQALHFPWGKKKKGTKLPPLQCAGLPYADCILYGRHELKADAQKAKGLASGHSQEDEELEWNKGHHPALEPRPLTTMLWFTWAALQSTFFYTHTHTLQTTLLPHQPNRIRLFFIKLARIIHMSRILENSLP